MNNSNVQFDMHLGLECRQMLVDLYLLVLTKS